MTSANIAFIEFGKFCLFRQGHEYQLIYSFYLSEALFKKVGHNWYCSLQVTRVKLLTHGDQL